MAKTLIIVANGKNIIFFNDLDGGTIHLYKDSMKGAGLKVSDHGHHN